MKKPVRVVMIGDAQEAFQLLNERVGQQNLEGKQNTEDMQLLKSIQQKIEFIKSNPFYGNNIKKKKIPKEYDVQNLWRVELTNYWRMLYTIKGDQIEILCFVVDILDHNDYNKRFKYKKKCNKKLSKVLLRALVLEQLLRILFLNKMTMAKKKMLDIGSVTVALTRRNMNVG